MNQLYLAWAYLKYHWARSLVLVASLSLILFVPMASRLLLNAGEAALTARAKATPYLLGSRGSALDLAMEALYFSGAAPVPLPMSALDAVAETGLAQTIPLVTGHHAAGAPVIGTSVDYFDFRGLEIADGRGLALLGEAVVGAELARAHGLGPGDRLISAPESLFDLDGTYPLEMSVVGVLAPSHGPDDGAVFVDIRTSWVIAGIGHGHEDVVADEPGDLANRVAAADIVTWQRITPENIDTFHFHGEESAFPVTAAIVLPEDDRAGLILEGRYLGSENPFVLQRPAEVVGMLVARIFRIRALLDTVAAIVAIAALAALGLTLFLSYRLRAREVQTARKLGAAKGAIARLVALEAGALFFLSGIMAAAAAIALALHAEAWTGPILHLGH